jgi:hypothetical protein
MRRLTLILSDLYLAPEAEARPAETLPLPQLEWLLSLAGYRQIVPDWRWTLLLESGRLDKAGLTLASMAAQGKLPDQLANTSWLLTPVSLEARLDHVRLNAQGLLSLAAEERAAWCEAFNQAFGPELSLHDAGSRAFLLTGLPRVTVVTKDPASLLGCDIAPGLPSGPDAGVLRRLGAEIEMWAHGHALNRDRERRRQLPLSGMWFWGGQGLPMADARAALPAPEMIFAGEDPCVAGLSRLVNGSDPEPIPTSLGDWQADVEQGVVVLAPMTTAGQSLAALESRWFEPAKNALTGGRISELQIYANNRFFYIVNNDRIAFWRRRYRWIESLGRMGNIPKA